MTKRRRWEQDSYLERTLLGVANYRLNGALVDGGDVGDDDT